MSEKPAMTWQERDAILEADRVADRLDFARRNEEAKAYNDTMLEFARRADARNESESDVRVECIPREVAAIERIAVAFERIAAALEAKP